MPTKITIRLNEKSISEAIKKVQAYQKWVEAKKALLIERLAMVGAQEASVRFASAMYDGNNDVLVSIEPTANGWSIIASGQAVCFIEFGTGVYHNPSEPYPQPRPAGVVGIGEYVSDGDGQFHRGRSRGAGQGWKFNQSGEAIFTRGNPAAMPMYYASEEMKREITKIAREVFAV